MDAAGIERIVDLDGGWGDGLRREIDRWQAAAARARRRVRRAGLRVWATDPHFGETEAAAAARGRGGRRAWAQGLEAARAARARPAGPARRRRRRRASTRCGRRPASWACRSRSTSPTRSPSSSRSTRERALGGAARAPGLALLADPPAGPPGPRGFPPFDELIDGLEAVVARHPGTTFIGAHVGCAAEDLARVSAILERGPNFHVDLAARIAELGRQPYTARAFIVRCADRVLFGTDMAPGPGLVGRLLPLPRDRATSRSRTTPTRTSRRPRAAGGSTACEPAGRRPALSTRNAARLIRRARSGSRPPRSSIGARSERRRGRIRRRGGGARRSGVPAEPSVPRFDDRAFADTIPPDPGTSAARNGAPGSFCSKRPSGGPRGPVPRPGGAPA